MSYLIEQQRDDFFAIVHHHSDCIVGCVALRGARYHVRNIDNEEIAIVGSLDDAIPALAAYYAANPPQWEYESDTQCSKWTLFGPVLVEQDQSGQWVAYRHCNDYPLLQNGQPAIFATLEEAKQAADAHASDGYPNSETIYDGFAFLPNTDPWWSYACRIAVRTKWWTALHACSLSDAFAVSPATR
jgi:hypothetical protein